MSDEPSWQGFITTLPTLSAVEGAVAVTVAAAGAGLAHAASSAAQHTRLNNLKSFVLFEKSMIQFLIYDTISPIIQAMMFEKQGLCPFPYRKRGEGLYRRCRPSIETQTLPLRSSDQGGVGSGLQWIDSLIFPDPHIFETRSVRTHPFASQSINSSGKIQACPLTTSSTSGRQATAPGQRRGRHPARHRSLHRGWRGYGAPPGRQNLPLGHHRLEIQRGAARRARGPAGGQRRLGRLHHPPGSWGALRGRARCGSPGAEHAHHRRAG